MKFVIEQNDNGMLLLTYLKKLKLSAKLIRHLKRVPDGIKVNGQHVTVRYVLQSGDIIDLAIEDTEINESITPVDLPVSVIYEDSDMVICSKPPFMPTHPSHDHYTDTLANALAFRYLKKEPFVFRPVNRLDRNTSGAVMIAKNARAASIMFGEMKKRKIEKEYIAVVCGEFSGSGIIDKPLRRTAQSIIVRETCNIDDEGAQTAFTEYNVLASGGGVSYVSLKPLTGRTHQLRVHLASIGHPICGDDLYGGASSLIDRQALHASKLTFCRPSDNKTITIEAPLPDDIIRLIEAAGLSIPQK